MKKHLLTICAVLITMSVLAGCAGREPLDGRESPLEQSGVPSADFAAATSEPGELPDASFTKEDYQKL